MRGLFISRHWHSHYPSPKQHLIITVLWYWGSVFPARGRAFTTPIWRTIDWNNEPL